MEKYETMANKYYVKSERLRKAVAAGRQLDNALTKEYSKGGTTRCYFRIEQYNKFFSYEALQLIK